ncbi:SDR family oxidoreductase [Cereibacter sphaeroides]|uniref:SDR family oxidoreductase n=1 Tax=Rhodobacterales TaxID=204455 RepID=UPI000BBEBE2D|nr:MULTISPECIES: SDR family oxidoreductase [Paracoccaceae]MCE6952949.1 SDR family oxidoreductase [Cereibacter sphaeroides]MCE6961953.1 SDR family oxidoreductase [Cereibacter sphaeroides]MCE6970728.1 SDR family oxidoreductase [Cereibacter sphaeroides]MCE6975676.1 SDR family oxidoreductase [Cereibacter sphaeroides]
MPLKVLYTGADGYVGALLGPYLLEKGIDAVGLDTGFYRKGWLYPTSAPRPAVITKDIRQITAEDLQGFDAVAHLAELSNDPLGQQSPGLTHEINHGGSVQLAEAARKAGVKRFVYMSSCSVYGVGQPDQILDETSPVNPQTAYAECKVKVEQDLTKMAGDDFEPCFLRNSTAYGASPRQRFDIVLNDLCGLAWTTKKITLQSDGSPWRPLVHALDMCQAVWRSLTAPADAIRGQCYNVGSNDQNYRVIEIARIVADTFPGCELEVGKASADNRSYRVNFDKIQRVLPEFRCEWTAERGARQMRQVFERIDMTPEEFRSEPYTRLKMLMRLRASKLLDDKLYWANPVVEEVA